MLNVPLLQTIFTFGPVGCSSYQAPCATPDGKGGVYLIFNTKDAYADLERKGAMSMMYHVTLGEDDQLRIRPVDAVDSLHGDGCALSSVHLSAFKEELMPIRGRALDIQMQIARAGARAIRISVLQSADKREHTDVILHMPTAHRPQIGYLTVDTANASLRTDIQSRIPETTKFDLAEDEPLNVRILLDKCMLEVFVNDRVVLMQMMYPTLEDSDHVSVTAVGGDADIQSARIYQMNTIYE